MKSHSNRKSQDMKSKKSRGTTNDHSEDIAHHHRKAAFHHDTAAHHHREAAKHLDQGNDEEHAMHADAAFGHDEEAANHSDRAQRSFDATRSDEENEGVHRDASSNNDDREEYVSEGGNQTRQLTSRGGRELTDENVRQRTQSEEHRQGRNRNGATHNR
jgi:hypothetical protein